MAEDDASARSGVSTRSGGSRRTDDGDLRGGYVLCRSNYCRALFLKDGVRYVCLSDRGTNCGRVGHKDGGRSEAVGCYFLTVISRRKYLDGVEDTCLTPEEYQGKLEEERAEDEAGLMLRPDHRPPILTVETVQQPSPTARSAFGGKPRAKGGSVSFQGEEAPSLTKTFTEDTETSFKSAKGGLKKTGEEEEPTEDVKTAERQARENQRLLEEANQRKAQLERDRIAAEAQIAQMERETQERVEEARRQAEVSRRVQDALAARAAAAQEAQRTRDDQDRRAQAEHLKERERARQLEADIEAQVQARLRSLGMGGTGNPAPSGDAGSRQARPDRERSGSPRASPPLWFGYVHGRDGKYGVTRNEKEIAGFVVEGILITPFATERQAWEWVLERLSAKDASLPVPKSETTPAESVVRNPAGPPTMLAGKDPSAKDRDKIFKVPINVDSSKIAEALAPEGIGPKLAKTLSNTLVDVLSLPGKTHLSDRDDVTGEIRDSLFVAISRQSADEDGISPDLKYHQNSRNALTFCKTLEELRELKHNVEEVDSQHLRRSKDQQRNLLVKNGFPESIADVWSSDGYLSTMNRRGLQYYLSLLDHLINLASTQGWDAAEVVVQYYAKKWRIIRGNCPTRLLAMCQLHVVLRDGYTSDWLHLKLTDKKVNELVKNLQNGSVAVTNGGAPAAAPAANGGPALCRKCQTILHGGRGCPWSELTGPEAKQAGREALRRLATGAVVNRE